MSRRTRRRMRRFIEDLKIALVFGAFSVGFPALMIAYWVVFGY
jgi:hypothetical protein